MLIHFLIFWGISPDVIPEIIYLQTIPFFDKCFSTTVFFKLNIKGAVSDSTTSSTIIITSENYCTLGCSGISVPLSDESCSGLNLVLPLTTECLFATIAPGQGQRHMAPPLIVPLSVHRCFLPVFRYQSLSQFSVHLCTQTQAVVDSVPVALRKYSHTIEYLQLISSVSFC